jgi:LmbE family N-acetylglucosaminyl deacetylase
LRLAGSPPDAHVLALAPHPDDFDSVGVTMRLFQLNGNPISVVVISGSANGVEDAFCSLPTPEHKAAIREQEQRDSCRFFGLPERNLAFLRVAEDSAGQLIEDESNFDCIRQAVVTLRPDLVFLPHGNDSNAGHRRTARMLRRIAQGASWPIAALYICDPKTRALRIDAYVPFDEAEAAWKAELLRFHRSQHQRNLNTRGHGFDERILAVNRQIARDLATMAPYAEAFEVELFLRH